jgi:hypothetical protein
VRVAAFAACSCLREVVRCHLPWSGCLQGMFVGGVSVAALGVHVGGLALDVNGGC